MSFLLKEDTFNLLLETGDKIILDEAGPVTYLSVSYVGGVASGLEVTQI